MLRTDTRGAMYPLTVQYRKVGQDKPALQLRIPDAGLPPGALALVAPEGLALGDPRWPDPDPNQHCGEWLWVRDEGIPRRPRTAENPPGGFRRYIEFAFAREGGASTGWRQGFPVDATFDVPVE